MQPARILPPEAMQARAAQLGWQSLHIFIHDFDQIGIFLRQCLAKMPAELSADSFFIRYWYGGPHIRLRFAGAERSGLIMAWVQRGLLACPDSPRLLPADFYPAYQPYLASEMEHAIEVAHPGAKAAERAPAAPAWYAHRSVQAIAYKPEIARYGGPVGLAWAEQHFVWDSHAALGLLEGCAEGPASQLDKIMLGYCFEHVAAWQRLTGCLLHDAVHAVLQAGPPVGQALLHSSPPLPVSDWALQQACERWQLGHYFPRQLQPLAGRLRTLVAALDQGGVQDIPSILSALLHMSFNRCGITPRREGTVRRCAAQGLAYRPVQGADHD